MGLFDPTDGQPLTKLNSSSIGSAAAAALNLRGTAESLVLLKNVNSTLPLATGRRIAVVGPHANASRFLLQVCIHLVLNAF
jgi:beta-glucosidase-like glycosyl hydrolase